MLADRRWVLLKQEVDTWNCELRGMESHAHRAKASTVVTVGRFAGTVRKSMEGRAALHANISSAIHHPPPHTQKACLLIPSAGGSGARNTKDLGTFHIFSPFFPLPSSRLLLIKSLGGWAREWARERERHASTRLYLSRQPPSTIGDMLKNSPARCITLLSEDYHWSCGCKAKSYTHARILHTNIYTHVSLHTHTQPSAADVLARQTRSVVIVGKRNVQMCHLLPELLSYIPLLFLSSFTFCHSANFFNHSKLWIKMHTIWLTAIRN